MHGDIKKDKESKKRKKGNYVNAREKKDGQEVTIGEKREKTYIEETKIGTTKKRDEKRERKRCECKGKGR